MNMDMVGKVQVADYKRDEIPSRVTCHVSR